MASSNAGPITGSELIRAIQGGVEVWLTRPQVVTLLGKQLVPRPRIFAVPTEFRGLEMFRGVQRGNAIRIDASDIAAYLAGTGTPDFIPERYRVTDISGAELMMASQGSTRVALNLVEVNASLAAAGGSTPTPTPTPTLNALTVSPSSATIGTAFSGTIAGLTSGSSVALSGAGAAGLSIAGAGITGTPTTAGAVDIVETLAGATNSPRTTSAGVGVVAAAVTLNALGLSSTAFTTGGATSVGITGKTSGSTVTATSSDGTSLSVSGSTLTGTFSAAGSPTISLVETLAGATNSPRTSTVGVTVSAASGSTTSVPVSDRAWVPTNTASIANNQTSRREHNAPPQGAITNLKFIDLGWYIATVGHVPASSSAYTIKKFVEYPAGTFTQVTWSGATSVAVGVGLQQTSDPVALTLPAGAKYWERTVQISGSAATMPVLELPAGSSAIGASDGNSLSDLGNSGTISPTSGIATIGSAAIIGDIAAANVRTFVVQGDSIAFGEGDISSVGANMSSGWISRGLAGQFAHVRIAKRGQAASEVAGNASNAMINFIASLGNYTDVIFELGINDVTAGRTQAQILADQQTLYGKFPAGVRKWQTTLTPRTSSTNSYADAAGQTVKTDGSMGSLLSINAAIRAKPSGVFGVIDASDYASTARDSGIWNGPFPPTTDGTHPTSAKAAAMGALLTVPTS